MTRDRDTSHLSAASWLVSGGRPEAPGAALNVPPVLASNFLHQPARGENGYARDGGTPTWWALEDLVGRLEGGEAVAFSSGMGAIAAIFEQLAVGAHIALPESCYQGVVGLVERGRDQGRWTVDRVATRDTDAWLRIATSADLIWLESPSNPLLDIADVATICGARRKAGALVAVDNTFATPLNQRPLEHGADVSVQSVTKYFGGHSDLLSGVATAKDPALSASLRDARQLGGATPGALEAYLAVRGARTMAIRLDRSQATAQSLAERLDADPRVAVVRYPGLPDHPGHAIARAQLDGFGSMLSFDVAGENPARVADGVCQHVALIQHATSLGAVESTIERRGAHPGQDHLPPGLLRLSVGIEDADDLWRDLDQALDAGRAASG